MIRTYTLILLLVFPAFNLASNLQFPDLPSLNQYVVLGLGKNLALKRSHISYLQALERVKAARGLFLPSLDFGARYTRAGGGRLIDIPIGDLANPIYSSLNQLLAEERFPTDLPNLQVPFLRRREHETRIRLTQQIFDLKVLHNYEVKQDLADVSQYELEVFKHHLINEIESSYFDYLKTLKIVENYEQSLKLLKENLRVTQRLFEAEKLTRDAIYRAEAQYYMTEQKYEAAHNNSNLARSYFNFLLNRPLGESVVSDSISIPAGAPDLDLEAMKALALGKRTETKSLEAAIRAARHSVRIAESAFYPSFSLVADYGYQGEKYSFTGQDDYWLVSGMFKWSFFSGLRDKSNVSRARLELNKLEQALTETRNQIELEVERSVNNVNSAYKLLSVAMLASRTSTENFRMLARKYEEGLASQIEYMDAQTMLTSSLVEQTIALYNYLIKLSELKLSVSAFEQKNL